MVETFRIFKSLEYVLMLVTVLCVGYIGYFFMFKNKAIDFPSPTSRVHQEESVDRDNSFIEPIAQPYESYESQFKTRDIFSAIKPVVANPLDKVNTAPAGQLPPNLKVVGIILSNPTQVIIEDQTQHQTFFIDQDHEEGGIGIARVDNNIVYLRYQGQTIEVPLKGTEINVGQNSL